LKQELVQPKKPRKFSEQEIQELNEIIDSQINEENWLQECYERYMADHVMSTQISEEERKIMG